MSFWHDSLATEAKANLRTDTLTGTMDCIFYCCSPRRGKDERQTPTRLSSPQEKAQSTTPRRKHAADLLTARFFSNGMDCTDSSTLRMEEEGNSTTDNIDLKLGNIRRKEISKTKQYAYMSNHVVVNQERRQRDIPLLTRCSILDDMAKSKAQEMANKGQTLQPYHSATMVESVHRTSSLQMMHQLVMHGVDNSARRNILDPRFVRFGMGSVRGKDGYIYVSQLFQGSPTANANLDQENSENSIRNPTTRVVPKLSIDVLIDPNRKSNMHKDKHKKKKKKKHSKSTKQRLEDDNHHPEDPHGKTSQ